MTEYTDDIYEEIIEIEEEHYRHYITVDTENHIINGWSDAIHPEASTNSAICITDHGSYQFRLYPDGDENPELYTEDGIPLYTWDGEKPVLRLADEINADRNLLPNPRPSAQEQMRADIDFLAAMQGIEL